MKMEARSEWKASRENRGRTRQSRSWIKRGDIQPPRAGEREIPGFCMRLDCLLRIAENLSLKSQRCNFRVFIVSLASKKFRI